MAKVFKFQDKKQLELDLNGAKFSVDTSDAKFLKNLKKFGQDLQGFGKEYKGIGDYDNIDDIDLDKLAKNNERILVLIAEGIDSLLGDGATKEIFGEREVDLDSITQVSFFIIGEINEYSDKRKLDKYSPQRLKG